MLKSIPMVKRTGTIKRVRKEVWVRKKGQGAE